MPASASAAARAQWHARLFPSGVPALWCPLLTHYTDAGAIDRARMAAHLAHLAPDVRGFLIPGSTGDGWELSETETREVLELAMTQAARLNLHLLLGVLKTGPGEAHAKITETLVWLKTRAGNDDADIALAAARVRGFTACPPRGAELTQEFLGGELEAILELGLPTALYQLPQVTQNEMSAELVAGLAARFANFILFKDTSGHDRVAQSGRPLEGVFLVRGAEGDYARWLAAGGGPYQGLLLSTANCFGRQLHEITTALPAGRVAEALTLSARVAAMVAEAFALVAGVKDGNAFANANKAMDHFFAHGPRAVSVMPPRLHAGSRLSVDVIRAVGEALTRHGLMPAKGYLE